MKLIEEYVMYIQEIVEKQRNKLSYKLLKKNNKKLKELERKYDKLLLEKYCFIEKYIEDELNKK